MAFSKSQSIRTGSALFSLVLTLIVFIAALPVSAKPVNPQRPQTRAVKAKGRKAQSQNLKKITARRGSPKAKFGEEERRERTDQPDEAVKAEFEKRVPKGATELPMERYFEAKEQIKNMQRYSTSQGTLLPSENETGETDSAVLSRTTGQSLSAGSTGGVLGTWQALGPGNVGGRTRAIIIDPVTPNTMYAAGVAGGVWKTTNAGASWSPLDDFMANIAVSCMAFEPGNSSVIYAGTGEGFFNADGVQGAGIFKSLDAGATWTRLASTTGVDFQFVNDLVVGNGANSQHVYAATRSGVWRSLDGGTTWAMIMNVPTVAGSPTGVRDRKSVV